MLGSWEFSGEPGHVHIRVCESPLCGVPGRYEYIWALLVVWATGLYGFSIFSGSVLAGTVRLKWRGCAVISFSFSSVFCEFSWRADMRGRNIVLYFL